MITEDLFDSILIKPAEAGCNHLYIVSGYATAAMAFRHLNKLQQINPKVSVELIVGMCAQEGLSKSNHRGFQQLMDIDFKNVFKCSYLKKCPPIHSKVYVWYQDNKPKFCFTGSANYTQTAFNDTKQRETMTECAPEEGLQYFESLIGETIYANHIDAENFVTIYKDQTYERLRRERKAVEDKATPKGVVLEGLPFERLPLLDNSGRVPARSGLNWGQRPEEHREPNQAYIKVPSSIYNSNFFPDKGVQFTVYTDNDQVLICARKQQNGKAIQTPHNNSLMGQYFRERLGLRSGAKVTKDDLVGYGRTDVVFYKIDNETYYMDFSKPSKGK